MTQTDPVVLLEQCCAYVCDVIRESVGLRLPVNADETVGGWDRRGYGH